MSVRPTPRNIAAPSQIPIGFKSEFTNSPAAIHANHEETMGKLLSRLDQLQAKVCSQSDSEDTGGARNKVSINSVFKTKPAAAAASYEQNNHADLCERYG
jgi:hypothetical protein